MVLRPNRRQELTLDEWHELPAQLHVNTRGTQCHIDVTRHRDPNLMIVVRLWFSLDGGKTWAESGFTRRGGGATVDKNGDPLEWVIVNFGHEPIERRKDWRGIWIGADPAAHRIVRGAVKVIRTPDDVVAAQEFVIPSPEKDETGEGEQASRAEFEAALTMLADLGTTAATIEEFRRDFNNGRANVVRPANATAIPSTQVVEDGVRIPHPAPGLAAMFRNRQVSPALRTRVHIAGTKPPHIVKSLVPTD